MTLHLTILHGTHNAITVSECDSYTWMSGTGETYTQSGTFVHHYIMVITIVLPKHWHLLEIGIIIIMIVVQLVLTKVRIM